MGGASRSLPLFQGPEIELASYTSRQWNQESPRLYRTTKVLLCFIEVTRHVPAVTVIHLQPSEFPCIQEKLVYSRRAWFELAGFSSLSSTATTLLSPTISMLALDIGEIIRMSKSEAYRERAEKCPLKASLCHSACYICPVILFLRSTVPLAHQDLYKGCSLGASACSLYSLGLATNRAVVTFPSPLGSTWIIPYHTELFEATQGHTLSEDTLLQEDHTSYQVSTGTPYRKRDAKSVLPRVSFLDFLHS